MSVTACDLIARARANGIDLWAEGERLRYRGHPATIEALLPELRRCKAELLAQLRERPPSRSDNAGRLKPEDKSTIRRWLVYIGETCPIITAEVLANCRTNPEALAYYLERSREVPEPVDDSRFEIVTFDEFRLSTGQRIAFKLAIPKERYDGLKLLEMLQGMEAR